MSDRYIAACNYTEGTKSVKCGAKAYVVIAVGVPDRVMVKVRSRGGRWIKKWESVARLGNWRRKTVPPEHSVYDDAYPSAERADDIVQRFGRQLTD